MVSPMARVNSLVSADINNYLTNVKKWGGVIGFVSIAKYGVVPGDDISAAINQALQENDRIYVPEGTYYIDPAYVKRTFDRFGVPTVFGAGIDIYQMSNKYIWFDGVIQSIPSAEGWIQIINIQESTNIHLYYPKVIGDKYTHLVTTGEWAHGMGIYSSDEVYIHSPNIQKTWGDGIYTGVFYHDTSGIQQGRVRIEDAIIDDVSRNGISLTSGRNTEIINPFITNTNRIAPNSGIDIEAEGIGTALPVLENVYIENPRVENCTQGFGLVVMLNNLVNRSLKTNIVIKDYLSINNRFDIDVWGAVGTLEGKVTFENNNLLNASYLSTRINKWHIGMP